MKSKHTRKSKIENALVAALNLQQKGDHIAAEAAFKKILSIDSGNAPALYSLGVIFLRAGRPDESLKLFRRGCISNSSFANNWCGCGVALTSIGLLNEALIAYEGAIKIKPNYCEALINCGALYKVFHRDLDALNCFKRALEIDPNNAHALGNAAVSLTEFNRIEEAIVLLERLCDTSPDHVNAVGMLLYARLQIGDWSGFEDLRKKVIDGLRAGKRVSTSLAFMAMSDNAEDHFKCIKLFADHFSKPPSDNPLWVGEKYEHKKLRIAYVSADLREHPVGQLMCGMLECHDKSRIETIAISLGVDDGSLIRQRMLASFDHFIDARQMTSRQIAERMREMEVDVAIDLGGYTRDSGTEIFSYRPAPISINFLGHPGTLAVSYMDYILADRHVIPSDHQAYYSEKVLYMPHTYLPTDNNLKVASQTPSRESFGLPPVGIVFCSFCQEYKINPPLWRVWTSLLEKVPGSVLWLMVRNELAQANLKRSAQEQGIAPERIIFATRVPSKEDHLARYRLADIFLDTWPYNAHTTAADALFVGLPVITYTGNAFPARVAGSLLSAVGLPDLAVDSWGKYEALALELATNSESLSNVKHRLSENLKTSPLFDTELFCRDFEDLLYSVAKHLVDKGAPAMSPSSAPPIITSTTALAQTSIGDLSQAIELVALGNYPQAELYIHRYRQSGAADPEIDLLLAKIGCGYGLPIGFKLSECNLPSVPTEKYLLIRAWGYGFWSDVHHVLGQLLVAELTQRNPIVWWGENSLFNRMAGENAFGLYFQPIGQAIPRDQLKSLSIYPAKWNVDNLYGSAVQTWQGIDSRIAAPYFFARTEDLVVSDFYATVSSIRPWIASDSMYFGMSDDEIYAHLSKKYLHPQTVILQKAEVFYRHYMEGRHWISVHARGLDRGQEAPDLHEANQQYFSFIDRIIELNPLIGIFLLTDSVELHNAYLVRYGDRLVVTSALRTQGEVDVHLQGHNAYQVGEDALLDVLLAIRGSYFIGNKSSNISMAIASLKRWESNFIFLFGQTNIRADNWALHNNHQRTQDGYRLCGTEFKLASEGNILNCE